MRDTHGTSAAGWATTEEHSGYWINEAGQIWPEQTGSAHRSVLSIVCHGSSEDDLICNVGYVAIRWHAGWTVVRLHRAIVTDDALASLYAWLARQRPPCTRIELAGEGRCYEMKEAAEVVIAQIGRLRWSHLAEQTIDSQLYSPRRLALQSPLRQLYDAWAAHQTPVAFASLVGLADRIAGRRYMVAREGEEGALEIAKVGAGLRIPDASWFNTAIGRRLEDQPDKRYWSWVSETFRRTLHDGRAEFSEVSAYIYWPRVGWVRRDYLRLLVPCRRADGSGCILSVSADPIEERTLVDAQ